MPLLSKDDLLGRIADAVVECGWSVAMLSSPPTHPFRLTLFSGDESLNIRVYIWNITHGGGQRSEQEYRIQVTGVPDISSEPGFRTLILGYWTDGAVFAGFDFAHHHGAISYSPSIQIRQEALQAAYVSGFAPHDKGGGELAIAFRPDYFVDYCREYAILHEFGDSVTETDALAAVAAESTAINESAIELVPVARRDVLRKVAAGHLSVQFRNRVLTVYQHRCAMCGLQMGVVEAAHIVPASRAQSSYETANGVALCATHHRAFDTGLVAFNTQYQVMVNEKLVNDLRRRERAGGERQFRDHLRRMIVLPPATVDRPGVGLVREGLRMRGWPDST